MKTKWAIYDYDVWCNEDGFYVNNRFHRSDIELDLDPTIFNENTDQEFTSYIIPDEILCKIFDVDIEELITEGDDTYYEINEGCMPIGEMICISHESL